MEVQEETEGGRGQEMRYRKGQKGTGSGEWWGEEMGRQEGVGGQGLSSAAGSQWASLSRHRMGVPGLTFLLEEIPRESVSPQPFHDALVGLIQGLWVGRKS